MPTVVTLSAFLASDVARLVIAVILVLGTIALLLLGRDVPAALWALDGAAISFYFSTITVKTSR